MPAQNQRDKSPGLRVSNGRLNNSQFGRRESKFGFGASGR